MQRQALICDARPKLRLPEARPEGLVAFVATDRWEVKSVCVCVFSHGGGRNWLRVVDFASNFRESRVQHSGNLPLWMLKEQLEEGEAFTSFGSKLESPGNGPQVLVFGSICRGFGSICQGNPFWGYPICDHHSHFQSVWSPRLAALPGEVRKARGSVMRQAPYMVLSKSASAQREEVNRLQVPKVGVVELLNLMATLVGSLDFNCAGSGGSLDSPKVQQQPGGSIACHG